jgi:hypothetical protein
VPLAGTAVAATGSGWFGSSTAMAAGVEFAGTEGVIASASLALALSGEIGF